MGLGIVLHYQDLVDAIRSVLEALFWRLAMKICKLCGKTIPFDSRATKYCSIDCRKQVKYQKDREWAKANSEKVAAYARRWYAENSKHRLKEKQEAYRQNRFKKFEEENGS